MAAAKRTNAERWIDTQLRRDPGLQKRVAAQLEKWKRNPKTAPKIRKVED